MDLHRNILRLQLHRPVESPSGPGVRWTTGSSHRASFHSRYESTHLLLWPRLLTHLILLFLESPRYLCLKGRTTEAWEVLQKIHRDPDDPTDSYAHAEFTQIVRQVEFDKEQKPGYIEMFKKPSWRRRSLLAIFIQ